MGSKKNFVKGLAMGAVLGAAASLMMAMKSDDKRAAALRKAADDAMSRVAKHAKKLGALTKTAYNKIVETTVAEYRGTKALSEDELAELKTDLKNSWEQVQKMLKK